jgi:hypothetical protein
LVFHLGVTTVTFWAKFIMLSCHDEKAGFDYFFQLFDEFLVEDQQTNLTQTEAAIAGSSVDRLHRIGMIERQ